MQHPFEVLRPEYEKCLATIRVQKPLEIDAVANKLIKLDNLSFGKAVQQATGVPAALILAINEREDGSDPSKALGQGDPWNRVSTHQPKGHGPFASRIDAAIHYVNYDHLNDNSQPWSWPYICWKGEAWNGFGPRNHGVQTGYLWSGTNIYVKGKYVADGKWDSEAVDKQLGIIPVMKRMIALEPSLSFDGGVYFDHVSLPPKPQSVPLGVGNPSSGVHDTEWLQDALNKVMPDCEPLLIDGSYGRRTRWMVREFQRLNGLTEDGLYGPQTDAALVAALARTS